jgi:glucokinase
MKYDGEERLAIGVDLGATKIASALIDRTGRVIQSGHTLTLASEGPAAVCDRIAEEIRKLLWEAGQHDVAGVGIGSPGLIDSERGIVHYAVNLHWQEVALAGEISDRLGGVRVLVEKDANINAVGEGMFGSAAGSSDYVLLTVGSGLGCGIVSGGTLLRGASSIAGDLGHYVIDSGAGRACPCGKRGCAETVVSGPGLVATMLDMSQGMELTPDAILAAAKKGDQNAAAAVEMMASWLGQVAAVAAAVVNPDTVIIGGGLGVAAFDMIALAVEREMYQRISPILENTIQLRRATLTSPAVGAASIVFGASGIDAIPEK